MDSKEEQSTLQLIQIHVSTSGEGSDKGHGTGSVVIESVTAAPNQNGQDEKSATAKVDKIEESAQTIVQADEKTKKSTIEVEKEVDKTSKIEVGAEIPIKSDSAVPEQEMAPLDPRKRPRKSTEDAPEAKKPSVENKLEETVMEPIIASGIISSSDEVNKENVGHLSESEGEGEGGEEEESEKEPETSEDDDSEDAEPQENNDMEADSSCDAPMIEDISEPSDNDDDADANMPAAEVPQGQQNGVGPHDEENWEEPQIAYIGQVPRSLIIEVVENGENDSEDDSE